MGRPRSSPVKPVRKRLADGTEVTYFYDRQTGAALGTDREAALARASRTAPAPSAPASGTLAAVITEYLASAAFRQKLKPGTKILYRRYLDQIRTQFGDFAVRAITPGMIQAVKDDLQDQPSKCNMTLAMFSIVLEHARKRGYVRHNAAERPGRMEPAKRTEIWPVEDEQRALDAFRPALRLAFMLLLYTVQRPGDVLQMTTGRVRDQDGRLFITLRQQKTDELVSVPVHARLAPLLRDRLATRHVVTERLPDGTRRERESLLLVASPSGKTWRYRNFARAWDHDMRRADYRLARELFGRGWKKDQVRAELAARHRQRRDLRRTGIVRLAEAGATTPQIAALSGHSIDYCQRIIDTYLPRRTAVALGGIELWEKAEATDRVVRLASGKRP